MSNRMNDVMKVLTIIATIFIPLSFVAGLYGMNFDPERSPWNMPELGWYWGYPFAIGIMASTALLMLFYFRRKGWLGSKPRGRVEETEERS
jgi:magnesium transporter